MAGETSTMLAGSIGLKDLSVHQMFAGILAEFARLHEKSAKDEDLLKTEIAVLRTERDDLLRENQQLKSNSVLLASLNEHLANKVEELENDWESVPVPAPLPTPPTPPPKRGNPELEEDDADEPAPRRQSEQFRPPWNYEKKVNDTTAAGADVLIITNSQGKELNEKRMYGPDARVRVHVLGEKYIRGAQRYIQSLSAATNPKIITFHCADNDLINCRPDETFHAMKTLIEYTRVKFQNSEIVVSKAFPRLYDTHGQTMAYLNSANRFNKLIEEYLGPEHTVTHANLHTACFPMFYDDGVHITPRGAGLWVQNLKAVLNPLLGLSPYRRFFGNNHR